MDVAILERSFRLRSEYDVTAPGMTMVAQKAFFSLLTTIELKDAGGDLIATLQSEPSFVTKYRFELADGRDYDFHTGKFGTGVYVCEGSGGPYTYYQHRGLRASIFQQDRQIAALSKNRFVMGDGNEYDVQMNRDADLTLVVCMVLAMNTADGNDRNDETFTIDFGNLLFEDRAFDESWTPN